MKKKQQRAVVSVLAIVLVAAMVASIVGLALSTRAGAVSRSEISALQQQKEALQAQQDKMQGRIDELKTQQDEVLQQKEALDEKNELNRQELDLINEQIELYDQMIQEKAAELEEAVAAEEEQSELYRTRMRVMEENGGLQYLSVLFQATSFSDFLGRLNMIESVMRTDNDLEKSLTAAREHTEEVKAEYEATQEEQRETKTELLDQKAELEASIEEAYELLSNVENNLSAVQSAFEEGEGQMSSLDSQITSKLAELAAEEERQRQAAAAAAAAAAEAKKNQQNNSSNNTGSNTSGGTTTPGSANGSGNFTWPLPGYSGSLTYGWRLHPILGYTRWHSGTDIGAPSGTPIHAADSGTVVTASYNSGGYGNYVILNHGNGYTTVYGHMTSYCVSVGQTVSKGQVIGYVGSTGLSTGPHLHFEVRYNGSTTNPLGYSYS